MSESYIHSLWSAIETIIGDETCQQDEALRSPSEVRDAILDWFDNAVFLDPENAKEQLLAMVDEEERRQQS